MKNLTSLFDTGTLVFNQSSRASGSPRFSKTAGRYLGLAAAGLLLAIAVYAALTAGAFPGRFRVLAALAAGLGLVQVWHGFDSGRLPRLLLGGGAGIAVIGLAVAAAPADAGLLAGAFLIAGVNAAFAHRRASGLWVPTAAMALTLASLSLLA